MTADQILALGNTVVSLENVGLVAAGGVMQIVKMFAPTHLTDVELDAIVDQVAADAARRRDVRATMIPAADPNLPPALGGLG